MQDAPRKQLHALIVEDEYLIALNNAETLEELGFTTQTSARADAAWLLLDSGVHFDLVFTDIDMPGAFNGLELATRIAKRWPDVRVLIASGRRIPSIGEMPDGACFLSKPYLLPQIQLALSTLGLPNREASSRSSGSHGTRKNVLH